ncbi:MAG: hypothetical protein LC800_13805 [Acidobacteria bacterium]|nr:hypothetical protein [Acidobacteriota bacterium]
MSATRRRHRAPDPLASPSAVRTICHLLRDRMSDVIPSSEKGLIRFLYAVRHVERRPTTDTLRGRPPRWPREKLVEAASHLRGLLERETQGRVSVNSFIGQYLPLLLFPSDVTDALASGRVNLQEAAQLARLIPQRLNISARAARDRRAELLLSHLAVQGSQTRLRTRVRELLGESAGPDIPGGLASVVSMVDELLEVDPSDARHMFWEEMKRLFFAMREVEPEDLDDETMDDFLKAMDQVSNVLQRIEKKKRARGRET